MERRAAEGREGKVGGEGWEDGGEEDDGRRWWLSANAGVVYALCVCVLTVDFFFLASLSFLACAEAADAGLEDDEPVCC